MDILSVIWKLREEGVPAILTPKLGQYMLRNNLSYDGIKISPHMADAIMSDGSVSGVNVKVSTIVYAVNYYQCFKYLRDVVPTQGREISIRDVVHWHGLYSYGYAPYNNNVMPQCESELRELIDHINGRNYGASDSILQAAADLYIRFVKLSPMANNNFQVAKLLVNDLLVKRECPPLAFFEDHRHLIDLSLDNKDVGKLASTFTMMYNKMLYDKVFDET